MKTWVIPDVHGCIKTLRYLVETMIMPVRGDSLILLGDMIDRGPDSKGVLDYVMSLPKKGVRVTALCGNHEESMIKAFDDVLEGSFMQKIGIQPKSVKDWKAFGGNTTIESFGAQDVGDIPIQYINWLRERPLYVKHPKFLIVHAGFNFKKDDIFSDTHSMKWIRDYDIDPKKLDGRRIIHGHVPVTLDFIFMIYKSKSYHFIDLDNGVYMPGRPGYGNLLALELNSMELLVQPNLDMEAELDLRKF
jgi:serine/threonine protein phosphatase 1